MERVMTNKDYKDEDDNLKFYENGIKEFTDEAFYVMVRRFDNYKCEDVPSFYYKNDLTRRLETLMITSISGKNEKK